mgnify:CR=1 FL=1
MHGLHTKAMISYMTCSRYSRISKSKELFVFKKVLVPLKSTVNDPYYRYCNWNYCDGKYQHQRVIKNVRILF